MTLNLRRSLILISLPFCYQSALAPAIAQITPDNTLGSESSVVTPNVNINGIPSERIDGGAIRDTNLFHSFQELNVGEGRGAYFSNPSGIENILGRVTGINRSNILGTLGVLGNANLFLINPNGIIFGPNARLDLRGSFVGSTADSLMFGNGFDFSATNPQAPPLLTVNIPIGLRFREPAAQILVQGVGQNLGLNGATGSFDPAFGGLRVLPGETLTLAGGNVLLNGGILEAPGGRVQLGGLATAGTLALNPDLSFAADTVASADVTLINRAGINVIANNGGNIAINAQNLNISQASLLTAGIGSNQGFDGSEAGDIQLNATGAVTITASQIENNIDLGAIGGNSGDISIIAGSLVSTDGAQLSTSTFEGRIAGDTIIRSADTVAIANSGIFSDAFNQQSDIGGQAGIVVISASNLVDIFNTRITTDSVGGDASGQAGGIGIEGRDIVIDSSAFSTTAFGEGFAGAVLINASDTVAIANSRIFSDTSGAGDAGNILIEADGLLDIFNSFITSEVLTSAATGNAGLITFTADTVAIANSRIFSDTSGSGDAGDILIEADGLLNIADGFITSEVLNSEATGNSGTITLRANSIFLSESAPNPDLPSLRTSNQGEGNAGNITIEAVDTVVLDGGQIFSDASNSTGLAGDIEIDAGNEIFIGSQSNISSEGRFGRIFIGESQVDLQFSPPRRVTLDGATLTTTNSGLGVAGDIVINALDEVVITNESTLSSNGEQGRIFIGNSEIFPESSSPRIVTIDGSMLTTITNREGQPANITITALDTVAVANSTIFSDSRGSGDAGDILLQADSAIDIFNSSITSEVLGNQATSNAGTITLTANSIFLTETAPSPNFPSLETSNQGAGDAGDITIDAGDTLEILGGQIFSDISGSGDAGDILLQADGAINITNGFITSEVINSSEATGNGGTITLTAGSIFLTESAPNPNFPSLETSNQGTGSAGDIIIKAVDTVAIDGGQIFSDTSNFSSGSAGKIEINASNEISIANQSTISSDGNFGLIYIGEFIDKFVESSLPRTVMINSSTVSTTESSGLGVAGDIVINARDEVAIVNQSNIIANGDIGRIVIGESAELPEGPSSSPTRVMIDSNSNLRTNNSAVPRELDAPITAGSVSINAIDSISINKSNLEAFTSRIGDAGSIILWAENGEVSLSDSRLFSTVEPGGVGDGGDIEITTGSLAVTNGAQLQALVRKASDELPGGQGNAGTIQINAQHTVSFDGQNSQGDVSAAFSTVEEEAVGNGGDIDITTGSLAVTNGAQLQALTRGQGNAGTVTIRARNTVSFDGVSNDGFSSGVFSTVEEEAVGNGGGINITTDRLSITNDAVLTSSSAGNGAAGNINIVADTTRLRNGTISSNTVGGEGNINLRSRALILRRGSEIIANASGAVNGGNITINSGVLAALENSDITANAEQGFGGVVTIEAQGVFGTQFREETTDESDITATSELGREFFGIVELNTPDVDPSRGLVTLPINVVDPASLIADNPCQEDEGSEFTVTGRGGLPSNPGESLRRDAVRVDLVEPAQSGAEEQGGTGGQGDKGTRGQGDKGTRGEKPLATSSAEKIVPAQGWVSNEKGEVVLTAYAPTSTTPQRPWNSPNPACPAP